MNTQLTTRQLLALTDMRAHNLNRKSYRFNPKSCVHLESLKYATKIGMGYWITPAGKERLDAIHQIPTGQH